jgi:CHAD domain-containing protein
MEASRLFLDAFDHRRDVFIARLKVCREEFSEASVHDLRVAARRLIAFVELAHQFDPTRRPSKSRRQLKDLIDGLDTLRDTQAMLTEIDEHARAEPSLTVVREHMLAREQELRREARIAARDFRKRQLKDRLKRLRGRLSTRLEEPDPGFDPFGPVDEAFVRVVGFDVAARPDDPAAIHRVRLAFKKFRYRFEIVQAALPEMPAEQPARLHTYQTIVGRVQDAETFLGLVTDCASRYPAFDPAPALAFYTRLRVDAIDDWLANRSALAAFWRPAPDQAFPWLEDRGQRRAQTP